jgi:unsaturated chondroitin disaccharide hydrolase
VDDDTGRKSRYADAAREIIAQLSGPDYLASAASGPAVLAHGTMDRRPPYDSFDTGTIWGDYYFLEALLKSERP